MRKLILSITLLISANVFSQKTNLQFCNIPKRTFSKKLSSFYNKKEFIIKTDSFQVSKLVTLKQYRDYLTEIKRDSSAKFYLSQLPDSTMCSRDEYQKYINSSEFEEFPVLGVTWESALNYCNWILKKDTKGELANFRYRLPLVSEWLSATDYLQSNKLANDFNANVSDWTYCAFDESTYNYIQNLNLDYIYFAKKLDPSALKRKQIMGASFLGSENINKYQQQNSGLKCLGFRVVKADLKNENEQKIIKVELKQKNR